MQGIDLAVVEVELHEGLGGMLEESRGDRVASSQKKLGDARREVA